MKRRITLVLVSLATLSFAAGCTTRVGDLTLATPRSAPVEFPVVQEQVAGEDCNRSILFFPIGNTNPSADAAIDDALDHAPEADALVNAKFSWYQLTTLVYNRHCLRVQGRAVRTQ